MSTYPAHKTVANLKVQSWNSPEGNDEKYNDLNREQKHLTPESK